MKYGRLLFSRLAPLASAAVLLSGPAHADSLTDVTQEISRVLGAMEGNLLVRDSIDMNVTDWTSHRRSIEERQRDYNDRVTQHNAYCQGTFEEEEYNRRLAECQSWGSQLDTLMSQLDLEWDASDEQGRQLQARETERATAYQQLDVQLSALLPRLIGFCATMTPEEQRAMCRLPRAPGPRTQSLVDELNSTLSGAFGQ